MPPRAAPADVPPIDVPPAEAPPADAIVVGAGPAGSLTALLLARRGLDVVLLDRAAFPRPKPCGDCLSAAATDLLQRHGLLDRVRATGPAWLEGWTLTSPGGHACTGRFGPRRGLAIERAVLDAEIRDAALEAGARPVTGHVVGLLRDPDTGRVTGVRVRGAGRDTAGAGGDARAARLVVGADGLRSVVARELGAIRRRPRLRKVSLTAHVDGVAGLSRLGHMYVLDGGCIGMAPVGGGRANLTLVVDRERAGDLAGLGPAAFFRRWLERVPGLPDRLGDAADPVAGEILASGPFDWPSRGPVAAGAALVGDAAGYYDPFTGQGIHNALAGAESLDREVGPVLESARVATASTPTPEAALDAALARYARAHGRRTRPVRRLQRLIEAVLSRPWLADRALARLARAPVVMDRLIEVTGDLRPPGSLLSPRLLSSFLIPATPREAP